MDQHKLTGDIVPFFYSYIKVPYNYSVKKFKQNKKYLEKYISGIMKKILEVKNKQYNSKVELIQNLQSLKAELIQAKNKMKELSEIEEKYYLLIQQRLLFLKNIQNSQIYSDTDRSEVIIKDIFLVLVIEYLVRQSDLEAAQQIELLVNQDFSLEKEIITSSNKIKSDLRVGALESALAWCKDNKSKLNRLDSGFELEAVLQSFIIKIKNNGATNAISYLQNNLPSVDSNERRVFLSKMLRSVVVTSEVDKHPGFAQYFSEDNWNRLESRFSEESFEAEGISTFSLFEIIIQLGIVCLKTNRCGACNEPCQNCPICSDPIEKLSKNLPSLTRIYSQLICRILGEKMDKDNPPVALPNNQVYSLNGLHQIAEIDEEGERITCPKTGEKFKVEEITKIYLLC